MEKARIIEVLSKWNSWAKEVDAGIRRDYSDKLFKFVKTGKVISVVGVRRAGKSTVMKQVAATAAKEAGRDDVLLVNFEEPEFEDTDLKGLQRIYDAYLEIIKPKGKPFVLLDEIQNVARWERFVRSLNERKDAFLMVSGSSSKLLSDELATVLAGRQIYLEVFPLSFKEFLEFNGVKAEGEKEVLLDSRRIRQLFRTYMEFGGFPEVVLSKDKEFKTRILRSYYTDILTKDVIARFKIKEADKLNSLIKFYLTNASSPTTFNSVSRFLNLPVETVRRFSSHAETSKSIFFIKRFSFSFKEQEKSPRKVYAIDVGLSNALGFRFSENAGKTAENLAAIELKRRQSQDPLLEVFYWKDEKGEVDFVTKNGLKLKEAIQVCWNPEERGTKERELKPLLKALKELKLAQGTVLTEDYEATQKTAGKKIVFKLLWKWLLLEA